MTYYGARDRAASFNQVRGNTIQIAEEVPEDKYGFRASPNSRSIAQTLVHIAMAPRIYLHLHRNRIGDLATVNFMELVGPVAAAEAQSRSKADVVSLLKAERDTVASFLDGLTDDFLAETVAQPPGVDPSTKSRFQMLLSVKEHEMHHRGQLMLMQRMIGITPHLTRQMEERMAQRAAAAPAR